jgi:hypothetical protein
MPSPPTSLLTPLTCTPTQQQRTAASTASALRCFVVSAVPPPPPSLPPPLSLCSSSAHSSVPPAVSHHALHGAHSLTRTGRRRFRHDAYSRHHHRARGHARDLLLQVTPHPLALSPCVCCDAACSRLPVANESIACIADGASVTAAIARIFPRIPTALFVSGAAAQLCVQSLHTCIHFITL